VRVVDDTLDFRTGKTPEQLRRFQHLAQFLLEFAADADFFEFAETVFMFFHTIGHLCKDQPDFGSAKRPGVAALQPAVVTQVPRHVGS
jgi:hypothetical protein